MERKYDNTLLDKLRAGQKEAEYKGVKVLVKPIPEGGEPGDMDPRLYKSMKMMPLLSKFMPKPKKNATIQETVQPFRKMFADYKGTYIADEGVCTEYVKVRSSDGYEVPVRIYKREDAGSGLPVFVYYHGGGFFGGGPDIVEQMCKLLVQNIDCAVLNVDYRLCPENHYPQPLDDCWAATRWAHDNAVSFGGNPNRMAVGGDSAGGNLASVITLRDREEKTNMVKLQVLLYPAVNIAGKHTEFYHGVDMEKYRCSKRHSKVLHSALGMMNSMMSGDDLLNKIYLQGNLPAEHIYASPLLDDFHNLPATMLLFGEHDMLAFEDIAYAQTAAKAGVPIKTVIYEGISHGYADQIGVMPQAEDTIQEIAAQMRAVL